MRLLAIAVALVVAAFASAPVLAQPLPASLRSAGVTEAEWSQAQGVIRSQAASFNLREDAIRTLAVEIFEGQPDLSFDACLELIREGTQRLPQLIAAARALDPGGDAALADLQRRAVAAAEAGRLREALASQDEYRAALQQAWERAAERPLLQLAAAHSAAGDTAYALGDYRGAAARYAEAADAAPASAVARRWSYRHNQAYALYQLSFLFVEPQALQEAVRLYTDIVLPMAPSDIRPADWALTQHNLARALQLQGERGMPGALERAVAAYEAALTVRTRTADPALWAQTQMNLGNALRFEGERGALGAFERAAEAYEAALTVQTPETDPAAWALTQMNLGNVFLRQSERGAPGALERAIVAYEAALTVQTPETDPAAWALTQNNLGTALHAQGARGAPRAFESAVAAYEAALTVWTPDTDPAGWAMAQMNLGNAFSAQSERGVAGASERAVAALEAALTVMTREANPAGWANTQMNLGLALRLQGESGVPGALERALTAFEAALTVMTRESDTPGWALTQLNLAYAFRAMGRNAEARVAAQNAIAGYEQVGDAYWANGTRVFLAQLQQSEEHAAQVQELVRSAAAVGARRLSRGSRDIEIEAGGPVNANAMGAPCVGYIAHQPSLVVNYRARSAPLFISATSDKDTTLAVRTPDGSWRCDDDSGGGLNAAIQIEQPESGRYAIWVGTFASEPSPTNAVLRLAPEGSLRSAPKRPNPAIDPAFGSADLAAGFQPDPHTRDVSGGGALDASALGVDGCVGFVSHEPAYRVNWNVADRPLSISVQSDGDTTLVISDPSGSWTCNDDSDGLNPGVTFAAPAPGQYNIWVGVFLEGATLPALLRITSTEQH